MNKLLFVMLSIVTITSTSLYAQLTENETKLFKSVQGGDYYIVTTQNLIDAGTNVNAVDPSTGNTPLHLAAGYRTVAALILKGANTLTKNNAGELPIETALEFYSTHLVGKTGETWEDPKKEGANFDENKDLFELLVKDLPVEDFEKLIYTFAAYENSKPLEWLLSVKPAEVTIDKTFKEKTNIMSSDYRVYNEFVFSALSKAAAMGRDKNIQLLLDNGADDYTNVEKAFRPIEFAERWANVVPILLIMQYNPKYKESYQILKNFDEKGVLGPAGVKKAVTLLESGLANKTEYEKLEPEQKATQNNLLFRYAKYCENVAKDPVAAGIALNVINKRYTDLTEYQKQETPRMGSAASYSTLELADSNFDETRFQEIAKNFVWGKDGKNRPKDIETAELAIKCLTKVANICNAAWANKTTAKKLTKVIEKETNPNNSYTDVLDVLEAQNGLLDYLYYRTLSMMPGKRTGTVAALALAVELDTRATGGYWPAQRGNIKILLESEKNIDADFKSISDFKDIDVSNKIDEIGFMLDEDMNFK